MSWTCAFWGATWCQQKTEVHCQHEAQESKPRSLSESHSVYIYISQVGEPNMFKIIS